MFTGIKSKCVPKHGAITVLVVLVLLLLTGCGGGGGDPQPQGQGQISGKVLSHSGSPLYNATISLVGGNKTVTTDRLGNFTLSGLPTGNQKLNVVKNGYQTLQTDVVINENVADYNVELIPNQNSATVNGVIQIER